MTFICYKKEILTTVASIVYNKCKQKVMGRDRPNNFCIDFRDM